MAVVQVHCAKQLPRTVRAAAPSCPAPRGVAEALSPCRHPQPGLQLWGASRKLDVGARGSAVLGAAQIAPSAEEQPPQEQSVAPPAQQHLLHVPVLPPCHHQPQTPEMAVHASVPPAPVPKQSRNQKFPKPGGLFINKQISAQSKHTEPGSGAALLAKLTPAVAVLCGDMERDTGDITSCPARAAPKQR